MLPPAATGSGASVLVIVITGERTVVVMAAPAIGPCWLLLMLKTPFVITVPLASGWLTLTTICTEPATPLPRLPMFQVTTPAARVPPAVALTKVVLAGIVSWITTTVAAVVPVLE